MALMSSSTFYFETFLEYVVLRNNRDSMCPSLSGNMTQNYSTKITTRILTLTQSRHRTVPYGSHLLTSFPHTHLSPFLSPPQSLATLIYSPFLYFYHFKSDYIKGITQYLGVAFFTQDNSLQI